MWAILVFTLCACVLAFQPRSVRTRTSSSLQMKVVKARNLDTKQTYEIEPGKPMSLAVVNTGLRLSFQCKKGDCGSCEFLLNGKKTRSCITKVPTKDFSIKSIKKIGK